MNKNRIYGGLVAGLIFAGALTACGSDDADTESETTETTKAEGGEKTTETTAATTTKAP